MVSHRRHGVIKQIFVYNEIECTWGSRAWLRKRHGERARRKPSQFSIDLALIFIVMFRIHFLYSLQLILSSHKATFTASLLNRTIPFMCRCSTWREYQKLNSASISVKYQLHTTGIWRASVNSIVLRQIGVVCGVKLS